MDSPANELLMVPMQYQPILLHSLILHFLDDAGFDPVSQALLVFPFKLFTQDTVRLCFLRPHPAEHC